MLRKLMKAHRRGRDKIILSRTPSAEHSGWPLREREAGTRWADPGGGVGRGDLRKGEPFRLIHREVLARRAIKHRLPLFVILYSIHI